MVQAMGARLSLVAEPDNPYDKNAVAVLFEDTRIGYVPRERAAALSACLCLGRRVSGTVTEVACIDGVYRVAFEAWFER